MSGNSKPADESSRKDNELTWYADGLMFNCLGPVCRACCAGEPGYVWLIGEDADKISSYLSISVKEFFFNYTFKYKGRISLKEKSSGDCIFLSVKRNEGCKIYEVRPAQCRAYPFWPEILLSRENWDLEASYCPGINLGNRLVTYEEIEKSKEEKLPPLWHER